MIQRGSGTLLLELLLVVGLTGVVAANGFKMIGKHHALAEDIDAKSEALENRESQVWTLASSVETMEINGESVDVEVWKRNW